MPLRRAVNVPLAAVLLAALFACSAPPPDPVALAAKLDGRVALPLEPPMAIHQRELMRGHLEAVQGVIAALAAGDLDTAARAGDKLGSAAAMATTCERMGAAADGFTEQGLRMHRTADAIGAAARAGDRDATLVALRDTLAACVACHAVYRQEIVDAETWQRRADAAAAIRRAAPSK